MNNGQQGGQQPAQPGQGAQQQQNRPKPHLFRPDQMRQLPASFPDEDKLKWEQGLRSLWNQIEKNDPTTQAHNDAKRKLFDFSRTLTAKLQSHRAAQQAQQAQQAAQQGQPSQQTRPMSQGQQPESQTQGGGENGAQNPPGAGQQQPRPQPKISPKLLEHATNFPYVLPPNLTSGTPEATKWIQDAKSKYLKALVAMEGASNRVQTIDNIKKQRDAEGKILSPEEEKDFKEKRESAQETYNNAKNFVDAFRNSQNQQRNAANAALQSHGISANAAQVTGNAGQAPTRPQMSVQQAQNPAAVQNTQTVNAAIEAAKNQQMGGIRPPMPQNASMSQPPQTPGQNAPSQSSLPQQQQAQTQIKTEQAVPPQINTAITQMQANQNRSMQNSPQSAVPRSAGIPQSATSQQPQALSHSDALHQAARSYSNPVPTTTVMGQGHTHPPQAVPREQNVMTNKMPIPKHLPDRATAQPTPVQMQMARPTYSGGPSNTGNGVISQPVLTKTPQFTMEGEGDRVLSKKKLDELVRQVTGGGQGLENGECLAPDVEESIMNMADSFIDQVLQSACKNAKERGSKSLDVRDIQLTLERGYNIRIPGYSSDEVRTVRKIQPTPNWINKMSAVTAAKVTGGKNAD
ncbi:uncharacterized protein LY89DRAFT_735949 [Mollisia scopiformis]|uniref:Transcription initiation factor TFIID subunit 12 domain-containing protein n=1 Tax=Mollisia scopiformis TaxID=149040 RepID=A0A194X3W8_MOLSC|nr:uncharacterized protein LY89DRAFT_735949 [Mollisia scopiformis]KUJ14888.1 hypothetical protein LY89DRAFT_735949 [Mollisia scopiformis]